MFAITWLTSGSVSSLFRSRMALEASEENPEDEEKQATFVQGESDEADIDEEEEVLLTVIKPDDSQIEIVDDCLAANSVIDSDMSQENTDRLQTSLITVGERSRSSTRVCRTDSSPPLNSLEQCKNNEDGLHGDLQTSNNTSGWVNREDLENQDDVEELRPIFINRIAEKMSKRCSSFGCSTRSRFPPPLSQSMTRDGTPAASTFNMAIVPKTLALRWKERGDNALMTVISAMYAKMLVVMGLAFPMTEVISNHVPSFSYLGFYLYLYFGSIVYFLFVFFTMLKKRAAKGNRYFGCGRLRPTKEIELKEAAGEFLEDQNRPSTSKTTTQHYGSFYLRVGAVAFGVGSMIYSGLEFAQYFETDPGSHCHNILMAVTPAARMVFTFIQMYFIFLNAKMAVYCKPRAIAYFGLMHMVATNLCIWLNVIIEETKHEILHQFTHHTDSSGSSGQWRISNTKLNKGHHVLSKRAPAAMFDYGEPSEPTLEDVLNSGSLEDECKRSEMMGTVVQDASQFLFPCAIEYSLICAAILYVMWKNVSTSEGESYYNRTNSNGSSSVRRSRHQYSVDCAKANKGLFAGIFILVGTIISLILFFALINNPMYRTVAIMEVGMARLLLFCLAFIATVIGIYQIRELGFDSSRHFGLDAVLLVVAQIGLMAYKFFTVIACFYSLRRTDEDNDASLVLSSAIAAILQAMAQTLFILDASRRHTYTHDQQVRKPGREAVTFLLMCNFAMWTVNTLEKSRADVNPLQLEFFGLWPWIIIMNVSMPLTIFYRFHSTVVLCEIWKRCYKVKPDFI